MSMTTTTDLSGHTLYWGEGNNGLRTVLTEDAHATLVRMYERAADGEGWDDIRASTPYPTGIFVFCHPDHWSHGLEMVATGTFDDLAAWEAHFTSNGGTMKVSEAPGNSVPLSNQFFLTREAGDRGADDNYPLPDDVVIDAFGITPDMLPERVPVVLPEPVG